MARLRSEPGARSPLAAARLTLRDALRRLLVDGRDLLLPAEGEEWLLGLLVLILLLGAARHRIEPLLEPPLPPVPPSIEPARFGRLDLNRATIPELESLPRIGPRLAERIVTHRETHGPFATVEDLALVRGIGPATVQRVAAFVRVDSGDAAPATVVTGSAGEPPPPLESAATDADR